VLIVDRLDETREVLQTALGRRGWRTFAAGGARQGLELAQQHQPDLIVLDLELDDSDPEEVSAPFAEQWQDGQTRLVVLGTLRRGQAALPAAEFVPKPYHYAALVRKIEGLLDNVPWPRSS
jgi:DNA-binding response OmpR family regulator